MPVEIAQSAPSLPVSDNATFTPAAVAAPQTAPEQGSEVADEEKDFIDEFCDYYGEWNKRGAANGWWGTLGYFGAQTIYGM